MSSTEYKIAVLGNVGIGKSAAVIRFVSDHYVEVYDPIIEDNYRNRVEVDDQQYMLDILDTYGEIDKCSPLRTTYITSGQGFLLAYSITSSDSFKSVKNWYEQIVRAKGTKDIPIVLAGLKCDMEDSRQVTREQGEELARELNCPFFETSAKNNIHIDDAFTEVVMEINARLPPESEPTEEPAENIENTENTESTEESKKSKFLKFFKRK